MRDFAPFRFATKGAPTTSGKLARKVSDLLVPAITKSAIDLWLASAPLRTTSYTNPGPGTSLKANPYEVTIVQNLFQLLSADPDSATPVWEAGFKATTGAGRPTSIDIVLEDDGSTSTSKVALFEFGANAQGRPRFDKAKIAEDLEKLKDLNLLGVPVSGLKQVYYVTIAASPQADTYAHFWKTAKAASPSCYVGARRFPIYAPHGWRYATVAVYQ